jgi:hypothetical protein
MSQSLSEDVIKSSVETPLIKKQKFHLIAQQYKSRKTKRQMKLMKKTISNRYSKSKKNYNGLL